MATRLTTILVAVIVGATFIAGLIVGAQRDDASGPVDLIIVNGKVYPGGGADLQEAVAVRGNQILRVGTNREVKRLRRAQTVVVDAHGGSVIPGLNDSHVQLMAGALALDHLDLSSLSTIAEIESGLRRYAEEDTTRFWVIAHNANDEILATADAPARKILDQAVPDRPVLVLGKDQSIAWTNSKALTLAGITVTTRNPAAGIVAKDTRTGEPTGVLKNDAVNLVSRVLQSPTRDEKLAALRASITEAHKAGFTSVQSVSATDEELRLLDEIRREGDLGLRVSASIAVSPTVTETAVLELNKLRDEFPDDPALKVGGVMVVCPCDRQQLGDAVALLDRHSWTVIVRTASGADVDAAQQAFEQAAVANPAPARGRRHQIDNYLLSDGRVRILSGSNWPEGTLDPRDALEEAGTGPGELRNAIDAYTTHAAYASHDEQRKGTLARGMLADIVILSNDISEASPEALGETEVTVTIFDGRIVYQRPTPVNSND